MLDSSQILVSIPQLKPEHNFGKASVSYRLKLTKLCESVA